MKASSDHLKFLKRRDFVLGCSEVIFNEEERFRLNRFGCWLSALACGEIKPQTLNQSRFLKVDRGELDPQSVLEILWMKLKARRQFEKEQSGVEHYRVVDGGEAWFSRNEHWRHKARRRVIRY